MQVRFNKLLGRALRRETSQRQQWLLSRLWNFECFKLASAPAPDYVVQRCKRVPTSLLGYLKSDFTLQPLWYLNDFRQRSEVAIKWEEHFALLLFHCAGRKSASCINFYLYRTCVNDSLLNARRSSNASKNTSVWSKPTPVINCTGCYSTLTPLNWLEK